MFWEFQTDGLLVRKVGRQIDRKRMEIWTDGQKAELTDRQLTENWSDIWIDKQTERQTKMYINLDRQRCRQIQDTFFLWKEES